MQAPVVRGIERIEMRFHGVMYEPHRHDTYGLGLTLSGVQTFRYRGASRAGTPGDIIILHPDELHDGAAGDEQGLSYRMLYLPPERLIEASDGSDRLPFVPAPVIRDEAFRLCLAEALIDLEGEPADLALDDLIARIAASLWQHADAAGGARMSAVAREAVFRCRDYLRDHLHRSVSSQELEAITGFDRYTIARQFRRVFGTSPHHYVVLRRLDYAKTLLLGEEPLAGIAVHSGFADQAHFTRHFKKAFGITPGHWRRLAGVAV
ncbi:AraC family transcriptional regulator [Oryzifoliimicrobium ureilyticus]|uniref:AraC family transcriptional regulator n=1 Tax=Oryzifoliimicrobium ureilyticus TaxID=3113724 RepID=UPI003F66238C